MATENLEVPVPGNIADNTVQEIPSAPLRGRSQKRQRLVSRAVLWLLLAAVSLVMVIPFAWMVFTALRSPAELGEVNPPFIPRTWHFENFLRALKGTVPHLRPQQLHHRCGPGDHHAAVRRLGRLRLGQAAVQGGAVDLRLVPGHDDDPVLRDRDPVSYTHLRAHETGRNLVC